MSSTLTMAFIGVLFALCMGGLSLFLFFYMGLKSKKLPIKRHHRSQNDNDYRENKRVA